MPQLLPMLLRYFRGRMRFAAYPAGLAAAAVLALFVDRFPAGAWVRSGIAIAVILFTVLAAIRAANRGMTDTGGTSGGWLLYLGALAVSVFGLSAVISILLPAPPPIPWQPPPAKVTLTKGHIHLTGPIDYRSLTELRALLTAPDAPQVIVLTSEGGHSIAGRSIGLLIAAHGRDTRVETQCYSACAIAFAGGAQRSMAPGAALGFHRPGVDHKNRVQTIDPAQVVQKDRAFLLERGFDPAFVETLLNVPPDELWQPDRAELKQAGVLN